MKPQIAYLTAFFAFLTILAGCGEKGTQNAPLIDADKELNTYYQQNSQLQYAGKIKPVTSRNGGKAPWGVQFNLLPPHIDVATHEYELDSLVTAVTDLLNKANRIGLKWARVSVNWSTIEDTTGNYHWQYLDTLLNGLEANQIEPYLCINGGHERYTGKLPPTANPEGLKAWKRFVTTMVQRYSDRVDYWEVWNEPNYPSFWKPEPNAADYVRLTAATSKIINRHDPGSTILGGSLARVDMPYAKAMFKEGIAKYIDVVTVHPYNAIPLGSFEKMAYPIRTPDYYLPSSNQISELRELIKQYDAGIKVWQAECGYPSGQNSHGWTGTGPWGENIQAKWLLRRGIADITHRIPVSGYFTMWEFKLGSGWKKNYKGLLEFENRAPKQSFHTYQNLAGLVRGPVEMPGQKSEASFTIQQEGIFKGVRPENIHATRFQANGADIFCYWLPWRAQELITPATVNLVLPKGSIQDPVVVDLFSGAVFNPQQKQQENGRLKLKQLPLTDFPVAVVSKSAVRMQ